jgi:hypothetical protein
VLALVAALFLWRSASSLLPPRALLSEEGVTGRDSLEGMTALLRRGIAEKELMQTCYAEWRKTPHSWEIASNDTVFSEKNVVSAYKTLVKKHK